MIKLDDINWSPPPRQLRQFGLLSLVALPLVGWVWGASSSLIVGLAGAGVVLAVIGLLVPLWLKPVFLALTIVAIPIGIVVGEVAMLVTFFLVMLPIGLLLRLFGKRTLDLKIDRAAASYWEPKRQPRDVSSYYHQS